MTSERDMRNMEDAYLAPPEQQPLCPMCEQEDFEDYETPVRLCEKHLQEARGEQAEQELMDRQRGL